jgi:uncharacterized membrane protein YiaA
VAESTGETAMIGRVFFKVLYWFAAAFFSLVPVLFQISKSFSSIGSISLSSIYESHYGEVMAISIVLLAVGFFSALEVLRLSIRANGVVALLMVPVVVVLLALFAIFAMNYGSYLAANGVSPTFPAKIEWYLFAVSALTCVSATVAEALAS